ncbi:helix-turn-helix transcriptional regulator [Herbiconiux ginsengi]|uniref:Transcriptional regulator, ArsR family n=1 Tax=Herbiconiux ginsengi TaxID=381665 RepID=A0A1H3U285_9MICO|nr:helix-turn-helix domain-containing protein [Herbiconiux ginsengi]SDZ56452.1 transcriptional regulator, ArsR family [Herbiconiux ginsengi]
MSGKYRAALGSASRQQVLRVLRAAPEPLDASAVAQELGLHVTTARFHLDQLAAAGLVQRRIGTENRRGRPRVLFVTAGPVRDEDAREQLIEVLAAALAGRKDADARASRAGRRWAETFVSPDPEDPVPGLIEVFERLGFDPETDTENDTIRLQACPFRGAAREHPEVVCAVHRGLIEQLLDNTEPQARLIPFVEAELCVVTLDRHPASPAIT